MIRVLVVEDDPLNIKLFRDLLQVHGYQVDVAATGVRRWLTVRGSSPRWC
jgi:CheY-like chemotaxis protein